MSNIDLFKDIRRVVSAERPDGSSYVASDGPPTRIEGGRVASMWATDYASPRLPVRDMGDDPTGALETFIGGPGDTRLNAMWVMPEGTPASELKQKSGQTMVPFRPSGRNKGPGWHATYSIDYMIVIRGEVICGLDEGDVLLKAGDVIVQGGGNHVWRNPGTEPALVYGITVGVPETK